MQRQALEVLREVRAAGKKLLPAMDKHALAGLTTHERNEVLGVYQDGEHIGNTGAHSARGRRLWPSRCEGGVFIAQVRPTRPTA
jgi:hypothetical protein